jgi:hypothetical protein
VLEDHANLATVEAAERQAARERRRHGRPSSVVQFLDGCFAEGVEVLRYGTELHLALFNVADAELSLAGDDDPAFATLKVEYADVLGGAPPGLQQEQGMELVLKTGDVLMLQSLPVKLLSEGELAELHT